MGKNRKDLPVDKDLLLGIYLNTEAKKASLGKAKDHLQEKDLRMEKDHRLASLEICLPLLLDKAKSQSARLKTMTRILPTKFSHGHSRYQRGNLTKYWK